MKIIYTRIAAVAALETALLLTLTIMKTQI